MSSDLAHLVGLARKQVWSAPSGSFVSDARSNASDRQYMTSTLAIDTTGQANFSDPEYQKNWQARLYERDAIERLNTGEAAESADRFMVRLGAGVRPRVQELHDRIIRGRAMERRQYIMQAEPTYFSVEETDPTLAMWKESENALDSWSRGMPAEFGFRPRSGNHIV